MKIALIGATGFVGSALVTELLQRGHQVTALARNPAKVQARPNLGAKALDAYDPDAVSAAVQGHDAVVSAFNPGWDAPELYVQFMKGSAAIDGGVALHGGRDGVGVVGVQRLGNQPGLRRQLGRVARQRGDIVAALKQFGEYGGADEAGGADQGNLHGVLQGSE